MKMLQPHSEWLFSINITCTPPSPPTPPPVCCILPFCFRMWRQSARPRSRDHDSSAHLLQWKWWQVEDEQTLRRAHTRQVGVRKTCVIPPTTTSTHHQSHSCALVPPERSLIERIQVSFWSSTDCPLVSHLMDNLDTCSSRGGGL